MLNETHHFHIHEPIFYLAWEFITQVYKSIFFSIILLQVVLLWRTEMQINGKYLRGIV